MKIRQLTVLLILLLAFSLISSATFVTHKASAQTTPSFFFGVDVAYENVTLTEQLIDKISAYTNFFIIGCTGNYNNTRLTEISNYLYSKNMYFLVYTDTIYNNNTQNPRYPAYPSPEWFQTARSTYGSYFLGMYYVDEPGGIQLDQSKYPFVQSADNYSDAATKYVNITSVLLRNSRFAITNEFAYPTEYQLFTSDYALYWYDYKAGYNAIFAEFGWNYSRTLNVALCRGAATLQSKDWGVMITSTNPDPPYIESGSALYSDMLYAYQSGAKYIIVFDSNPFWTADILGPDQLGAMQMLWEYAQNNPRSPDAPSSRVAYVLPQDFGFGFRGPEDTIWGLWPASSDPMAYDLSISVQIMLTDYGNKLDLVYEDGVRAATSSVYGSLIYWDDPGPVSQQWDQYPPSIVTPTPGPPPTPSPTPSLSPSPTFTPSASPSPSPTPTAPTQQPSSTPDRQSNSFLNDATYIISALALAAVASFVAFIVKRRRR